MKGKHQHARRNRQAKEIQAQLEKLRVEIDAESRRVSSTQDGAQQTRAARRRLTQELAVTDNRLRPQQNVAGRVVSAAVRASTVIADARREVDAVERVLSRLTPSTVREVRQTGMKLRFTQVHRSAAERYVHTWYRKQTGAEFGDTRTVHLSGWVPEDTSTDRAALAPFATSTVLDTSPQAAWAWAVPPWLRHPDTGDDAGELRRRLGATTSSAPAMPSSAYPGPYLRADATVTTPWRHLPLIAAPADAVDLVHWYHRSAWIQRWHPEQTAVPFWLPAEHAVAYPQARPLPEGTDIRLPFPLVFAAFATPWRIEPLADDFPADLISTQLVMLHARGRAANVPGASLATHLARLQATGLTDRNKLPTPLEALDRFGGVVEGLLLAANQDGTPKDEFAWCIAIGHPIGLPIARITIPASRTANGWRTEVDNITAGIAFSCWHDPLPSEAPSTRQPSRHTGRLLARTADIPAVRVLDIDATSPQQQRNNSAQPATNARPHLRRGHFRKQRVGPGRQDRRWTWVRPTTVNGGSSQADKIYLLRG